MSTANRAGTRTGTHKMKNEKSIVNRSNTERQMPSSGLWLHRYSKLVVLVSFVLIVAGGLVTSTPSGLSVPDWPLSYGQWMPPMVGGVFYEHSHRMIAAAVGFMTLILAFWIGMTEKRAWLRWLGIGALAAVVVQGLLGGMTVLFLLPAPVSIFHACLAQTFFALLVSVAYVTSQEWRDCRSGVTLPERDPSTPILKKLVLMTTALIYAQLILGATVRHTDASLVIVSHVIGAFFVLVHILFVVVLAFKCDGKTGSDQGVERRPAPLKVPAAFLGVVFILQMGLGIGAFIYTRMLAQTLQPALGKVFFVTAHQTLGALVLASSIFLSLRVFRREPQS